MLGLVKFGQCPPHPGGHALEVGQRGHAGDRPEHEPEDGFHSLFLPRPFGGLHRAAIYYRSRAAGYGLDDGDPAARPPQTKAPLGAGAEPDSYPITGSHPVHPHQRTHAWMNNYGKLIRCTERHKPVVEFYLALASAIVTPGRLIRQAWSCYRWQTRPRRRP